MMQENQRPVVSQASEVALHVGEHSRARDATHPFPERVLPSKRKCISNSVGTVSLRETTGRQRQLRVRVRTVA